MTDTPDYFNPLRREVNKRRVVVQSWDTSIDYEDLSVRGGLFNAAWDPTQKAWTNSETKFVRILDRLLREEATKKRDDEEKPHPLLISDSSNGQYEYMTRIFRKMVTRGPQRFDERVIFNNQTVRKEDYSTKRVPYDLYHGEAPSWDRLMDVLYQDERTKIEWAIGSVFNGYSKVLQKFFVFYGAPGTGKSTVLQIIEMLFRGYTATVDAKELVRANSTFATGSLKNNPLVILQHDADLSKVSSNSTINAIVSHETIQVNEKYAAVFDLAPIALMFLGTNENVDIISSKSGLLRRLVDIHSTGQVIPAKEYKALMRGVKDELGAIASKCQRVFEDLGPHHFDGYQPTMMLFQSNDIFNFVADRLDQFLNAGPLPMKRIWAWYKEWCEETNTQKLKMRTLRTDLMSYFDRFEERGVIESDNGEQIVTTSIFHDFRGLGSLRQRTVATSGLTTALVMDLSDELTEQPSIFDKAFSDAPAQLANNEGNPLKAWGRVKTKLADVDTSQLHWVRVPENHVVIDFDLVDEDGNKSFERNCHAASEWPPTYTEVSKSGRGIHLHYKYEGPVIDLADEYDVGIEIKRFPGNSSLRRRLTLCNNRDIAVLRRELPKKKPKEQPMLDQQQLQSEKALRELIERNLRKEIHQHTKPSIDFIKKILDDAYEQGLSYDVSDMRSRILSFAMSSTNQAAACTNMIRHMKFMGPNEIAAVSAKDGAPIVFFDIEVFPNLVIVCYKHHGADEVMALVNPSPKQVEPLLQHRLVGFNNRHYDNHILYALYQGWSVPEVYALSKAMVVDGDDNKKFPAAYKLSYADVYDFSSKKQGLKRFMHELKIKHVEIPFPFDKPVPEEEWPKVVSYCKNDVVATEAVFMARQPDFVARQILASLSGLTVNDTTQTHAARIIFGEVKRPQDSFVYMDLSKKFPGYTYDPTREPKSLYQGEDVGEGGYVYVEPGFYRDVAHLDVASMHPTSIEIINLFGPYTKRFVELKNARLAIKHGEYESARQMFNGKLQPFLEGAEDDPRGAEDLAYALKIVINVVYGLTAASFANPFRDPRNVDNIVAKHGALFMVNLKQEIKDRGFTVVHIKTDSIKIANATPEIIEFVMEYGREWGYTFEHEATYSHICLVNAADYIACEDGPEGPIWTAVGAKFQHPYVFKRMFSHEDLEFEDFCELKTVKNASMYLDFTGAESKEDMVYVGRSGVFVPVRYDGGALWRIGDDDRVSAVAGTKDYRWITRDAAEFRMTSEDLDLFVDMEYFERLVREAADEISQYGWPYINEVMTK